MKYTCVDLFCGLGGWSSAFKDRGWNVITQDWDGKFNPDICKDIMDVVPDDLPKHPEIILASPPCNCFSVNTIGKYWKKGRPTLEAMKSLGYVGKTLWLIANINPTFWIIENPRGMLVRFLGKPDVTTYFASWGNDNLKPTNLWGKIPPMEWPKPINWTKCPRGESLGTRSLKSEDAAMIPYKLSLAVCEACENHLDNKLNRWF